MRSVVVDKLASVTQACGLSHEVRIAADIPAEEGVVVVVEVLTNKSTYNTLELTSGRMAKVGKGDVVAGALGHRQALFGYSGHVPPTIAARRHHPDAQHRRRARDLRLHQPRQGQALRLPRARRGAELPLPRRAHRRTGARGRQGASIVNAALDTRGVPVVALAGTCMEAGKTAAACAIIARMRHRGLTVDAFKATGVSLRRDILAMEDAGARRCAIFTDLGIVTTTRANGPALTRTMLTRAGRRQARRDGVRARRRHPRHLRRGCDPRMPGHPRRAHRRGAVGQRSGGGLGRREAAARALRRSSRAW